MNTIKGGIKLQLAQKRSAANFTNGRIIAVCIKYIQWWSEFAWKRNQLIMNFCFRFSCTYLYQETSSSSHAFWKHGFHWNLPSRRFSTSSFKLESTSSAISFGQDWTRGWKPHNNKPKYYRQWFVRVCCDERYGCKEDQDEPGGAERRLVLITQCKCKLRQN